jgi:hypothetical protein
LLFTLGVVLIIKFGSVELDSYSKLRESDQYSTPDEGNSYAEWLMRQSVSAEIEDKESGMIPTGDHDAAEAFFEQAIDNLANGVPQSSNSFAKALDEEDSKRKLGQPLDQQTQLESPPQPLDVGRNEQLGIKSQYESARPLPGAQSLTDTQQVPQQEFQGFQEALAQQQLQQAIVQQQQQQPLLDMTQQNNVNPEQPNPGGQMSLIEFAKSQQTDKAFLLDPSNQNDSQVQPLMPESNFQTAGQAVVAPDSNNPAAVTDGLVSLH